jgi:hypothetical protein
MSKEMFIQTRLTRKVDDGIELMVSHIPVKIAIQGAVVNLKDGETDQWTYGWTVMDDCQSPEAKIHWRPYDVVNEQSQAHKSQRVGSDIERGSREKMKKKRH